ncbi:B3 domain-containing protein At5g60130 isoform X1 [Capsicum annuum]|uniref:B3 domain-containing protein At5g60130 isoform X1 n=2 Tax=Capsicum annuum TaxID=4072 RepID=UPI0007BFA345|nr:B3 domain-containing protein At5g60130 isoform X1 [Capsicum annuum]
MEKGFFKLYSSDSAKRLFSSKKIPTGFTDYKNGKLPWKVSLRDRFGNMWTIEVTKTGREFYFQYGWVKFIEDNTVEFGDFFIFDYDGNGIFDFKLLGKTGCEKKGVGGLKLDVKEEEEEEISVENRKNVQSKAKNWASDSTSSSSDDDSDEECYMVEEEEEEDEEYEETEKVPCSIHRYVAVCKARDRHDPLGTDIFRSGRATPPKNPYFVAKIIPKRRNQLFIPLDVVRGYKLKLPSSMTIRDSVGREFEAKCKSWKDGRIFLTGGWSRLCRWNLAEKNDLCICEFVRGERNKGLYLQVQFLHEGASSHLNEKNIN